MPVLATDFLAGAILTLLVPALLLIGIAVWHLGVARHITEHGLPETQAPGAPPPVTDQEHQKL